MARGPLLMKMQIEKASASVTHRNTSCARKQSTSEETGSTKKRNTCKKSGLTTIQISIAIPDEALSGAGSRVGRTAKV